MRFRDVRSRLRYGPLAPRARLVQRGDDHDWGLYTDESYRAELEMVAREHTVLLSRSDLHDGRVAPEKPLRPSHALLYDLASAPPAEFDPGG